MSPRKKAPKAPEEPKPSDGLVTGCAVFIQIDGKGVHQVHATQAQQDQIVRFVQALQGGAIVIGEPVSWLEFKRPAVAPEKS